jgi:hypothetical protein
MIYSDVVNKGWILPKKAKYTMRDVKSVQVDSLMNKYGSATLSTQESKFIIKCSAAFHETQCSIAVYQRVS